MKTIGTVLPALGALVLSLFGLRGVSAPSAPVASFQVASPGPVAGQAATFVGGADRASASGETSLCILPPK